VCNPGLTGTISLASTISITDGLTITGPGARVLTISGNNANRILSVTAPTTISGLRLANGFTDRGAAIAYNASGLLSVSDCHFDQNLTTVDGGAILRFQGSLSAGCPTDADTDGVFDGCDHCPGSNDLTDVDDDGVPDCLDACQVDADCDDGDACTEDVCAVSGCENVAPAGLAGAERLLSAALSEPLCPAGTIDPTLVEFAAPKLERALERVRKAAQATKPKQRQRLVLKASNALGKILQQEPGATNEDCLQRLTVQLDEVLDTLAPPPLAPAP
jgi:hypothetical protein